jgi:hypothetical protein
LCSPHRAYKIGQKYYYLLLYIGYNFVIDLDVDVFLAANPEVPGSIPGATRFFEQQWVWNGVHLAVVRINEEILERRVAAPV